MIKDVEKVLGEGGEFVQSVRAAVEERFTSPFWGHFFLSWLVVNWNLVYVAFFVDADTILQKKEVLRNEYLYSLMPQTFLETAAHFLIYPLLISAFIAWVVSPTVGRAFFKRSSINKREQGSIEKQINENLNLTRQAQTLVEEQKKLVAQKVELEEESKKAEEENPRIFWEQEFEAFKESRLFYKFKQVVDTLYAHQKQLVYVNDYGKRASRIDPDMLAYADSHGLITIDNSGNRVEPTDKGRFFLAQYSE